MNYNKPGKSIKLLEPAIGARLIIRLLQNGRSLVLLCACKDYERCHRKTVYDLVMDTLNDNSPMKEREATPMRKRKALEEQAPMLQAKKRQKQPPQPVVIDQLLTITQAATRLGLGRTKIYDLINSNQLPYVEIPGSGESTKRISALTLNTWIKNRETVKHAS